MMVNKKMYFQKSFKLLLLLLLIYPIICETLTPVVVNTWPFTEATKKAWKVLQEDNGNAIDAVEAGCSMCEQLQCDGTVGFGGSPDESGETTLDAMIMDGDNHNVGAVADLRRIKHAISVARRVMENTEHTLLVGNQATEFAKQMGFREETLSTNESRKMYTKWRETNCQPNYWINVQPDPKSNCGPYLPINNLQASLFMNRNELSSKNHDTIGMIVIDKNGKISVGTSTNGLSHKIPGRVGDSPLPGSGGYAEKDVGAAAGTGDGDVMMRYLPAYQAIVNLRMGFNPWRSAKDAIQRISKDFPNSHTAIIVVNKSGEFGAACHGFKNFPFSVRSLQYDDVQIFTTNCTQPEDII